MYFDKSILFTEKTLVGNISSKCDEYKVLTNYTNKIAIPMYYILLRL